MPLNLPISPSELDPTSTIGRLRDAVDLADAQPQRLASILRQQPELLPQFNTYLSTTVSYGSSQVQVAKALADQMVSNVRGEAFSAIGAIPGIGSSFAAALGTSGFKAVGLANTMAQVLVRQVLGGYGLAGAIGAMTLLDFSITQDLINFVQKNVVDQIDGFIDSVTDSDEYYRGQFTKLLLVPEVRRVGLQLIEVGWDKTYTPPGVPMLGSDSYYRGLDPNAVQAPNGAWLLPLALPASGLIYVLVSPVASRPIPTTALNLRWNNLVLAPGDNIARRDNTRPILMRDPSGAPLPAFLMPGSVYRLFPERNYLEYQPGAHLPPGVIT